MVELKKIYRQAEGSHIISNAHCILNQQQLYLTNRSKDFFFKECDEPEKIREMLLHYVADSLPAFTGEKDIQVLAPVRGRYLGVNELNISLQERLNPAHNNKLQVKGFRVGDKVIQIVNDYNRERQKGNKRKRSSSTVTPEECPALIQKINMSTLHSKTAGYHGMSLMNLII